MTGYESFKSYTGLPVSFEEFKKISEYHRILNDIYDIDCGVVDVHMLIDKCKMINHEESFLKLELEKAGLTFDDIGYKPRKEQLKRLLLNALDVLD